jgi:hypothetical protein
MISHRSHLILLTIAILARIPGILIIALHLRRLSLLIPIVPLTLIPTTSPVTATYHGGRVRDSLVPGGAIVPFLESDDGYEEAQNSYDGTDDCRYHGCC